MSPEFKRRLARLARLSRRTAPAGNGDAEVIRVVLDGTLEPREFRAKLLALPPGDMRDHFLDAIDGGGSFLPTPGPPDWEPPGVPVHVKDPRGFTIITYPDALPQPTGQPYR